MCECVSECFLCVRDVYGNEKRREDCAQKREIKRDDMRK